MMIQRMYMFSFFVALLILSVSCAAPLAPISLPSLVPATAVPPSPSVGVKVETEGGAYTNVTPAELKTMLDAKDFFFVNTHTPYKGEIAQTDAFVPYNALDENLSKFPADRNAKILVYCRSDMMSTVAAKELVRKGFTNVWNLTGGMAAWEKAGMPLLQK
jgi:rhodanese-related sulfurtransferase